jgi:hypothetical protein
LARQWDKMKTLGSHTITKPTGVCDGPEKGAILMISVQLLFLVDFSQRFCRNVEI